MCDFRKLKEVFITNFDIVITCNSFPHLLTNVDITRALKNIYVIKPNGLFLASIKDYNSILESKPTIFQPSAYGNGAKHWLSFEEWNWQKRKPIYKLNHFIIKKQNNGWKTVCRSANLRAIKQSEFTTFLLATGFKNIKWHLPEDTGFFQPIVTAIKN